MLYNPLPATVYNNPVYTASKDCCQYVDARTVKRLKCHTYELFREPLETGLSAYHCPQKEASE